MFVTYYREPRPYSEEELQQARANGIGATYCDAFTLDYQACMQCELCIQVCPTGALFQKGKAVSEMSKRNAFLPYIVSMRHKGERHE